MPSAGSDDLSSWRAPLHAARHLRSLDPPPGTAVRAGRGLAPRRKVWPAGRFRPGPRGARGSSSAPSQSATLLQKAKKKVRLGRGLKQRLLVVK